jgi:hypothetical protein
MAGMDFIARQLEIYSAPFPTVAFCDVVLKADILVYTGHTQKNGAVSKVNKKFISHLTRAQHTPSAAATVHVSHLVITLLQYVHPGSHDTHPHGN